MLFDTIFSFFVKNQDKLNASNSINNEQKLFENNSKIQDSRSSESCNNLSNVMEAPVSLIYSPGRDHQYAKVISLYYNKFLMC